MTKPSSELFDYESLLRDCNGFISSFAEAIRQDTPSNVPGIWRHVKFLELSLMDNKLPRIYRESLTTSVSQYLDLPVRLERIDRYLIDTLVASELFAYARSVKHVLRKTTPVGKYLLLLRLAPIWAVLALTMLFAASEGWITRSAAKPIMLWAAIAGVLYAGVLEPILGGRARQLFAKMTAVYEILEPGPVSARHISRQLDATTAVGAVWPPALYVLIDDILERSGRF